MIAALLLMLADAPTTIPELIIACDGSATVGGSYFQPRRYQRAYRIQLHIIRGNADMFMPMLGDDTPQWLPVQNLVVTDTQITGKVRDSVFGSSSFSVDRTTGTISTERGYSGSCTKADPEQRAF